MLPAAYNVAQVVFVDVSSDCLGLGLMPLEFYPVVGRANTPRQTALASVMPEGWEFVFLYPPEELGEPYHVGVVPKR